MMDAIIRRQKIGFMCFQTISSSKPFAEADWGPELNNSVKFYICAHKTAGKSAEGFRGLSLGCLNQGTATVSKGTQDHDIMI